MGSTPTWRTKELYKYRMRILELLTELTFGGSQCTRNCIGHVTGFNWKKNNSDSPCLSTNASFNKGCAIADKQIKAGRVRRPGIRDTTGRYTFTPKGR